MKNADTEDTWTCGDPDCDRTSVDPLADGWQVPAPSGKRPVDESAFRCREHRVTT